MHAPITNPSDPIDAVPADNTTVFEYLHPHARWGMRLGTFIGFALIYVPVVGILLVAWDSLGLGALARFGVFLLGLAGVAGLAWAYANASYRHARFALTQDGLHIRRGVFWRNEILVPRSRVQHTDLNRGPIDRALGLATLKVYTAGTKLASVAVSGLPDERAVELRDALVSADDDAV